MCLYIDFLKAIKPILEYKKKDTLVDLTYEQERELLLASEDGEKGNLISQSELNTAASNPDIGIKTKLENIRGLIIRDYILFYEVLDDRIMVLKVWACRQDPNKLDVER